MIDFPESKINMSIVVDTEDCTRLQSMIRNLDIQLALQEKETTRHKNEADKYKKLLRQEETSNKELQLINEDLLKQAEKAKVLINKLFQEIRK